MKTFRTNKGTELHMLNLKGKDYLQVSERLIWFREEHPDWGIETSVSVNSEKNGCLATAWVKDPSGRIIAMGHKYEDSKGFPDYIEKSSTGAIGRALALCGYGTQFAPELDEGERIVDSPIEKVRAIPTPHAKAAAVVMGQQVDSPQGLTSFNGNPGTVLVPFGRNKGKPIFQLQVNELEADLAYWETRARADGKPLTGKPAEYVAAVNAYLDQKKPSNEPPMPTGPLYPIDEDVPF